MPLLVYSYPDFTPNTVILSAQVNAKYNDIKTLLNTTKLNDDNIQTNGITRGTKLSLGTASGVVINDGTGAMTDEATLSPLRGGLGVSITLGPSEANKIVRVNSGGTAFELQGSQESVGAKLFLFSRVI